MVATGAGFASYCLCLKCSYSSNGQLSISYLFFRLQCHLSGGFPWLCPERPPLSSLPYYELCMFVQHITIGLFASCFGSLVECSSLREGTLFILGTSIVWCRTWHRVSIQCVLASDWINFRARIREIGVCTLMPSFTSCMPSKILSLRVFTFRFFICKKRDKNTE